eukprot:7387147-Prymnesium_polylepis.1
MEDNEEPLVDLSHMGNVPTDVVRRALDPIYDSANPRSLHRLLQQLESQVRTPLGASLICRIGGDAVTAGARGFAQQLKAESSGHELDSESFRMLRTTLSATIVELLALNIIDQSVASAHTDAGATEQLVAGAPTGARTAEQPAAATRADVMADLATFSAELRIDNPALEQHDPNEVLPTVWDQLLSWGNVDSVPGGLAHSRSGRARDAQSSTK